MEHFVRVENVGGKTVAVRVQLFYPPAAFFALQPPDDIRFAVGDLHIEFHMLQPLRMQTAVYAPHMGLRVFQSAPEA